MNAVLAIIADGRRAIVLIYREEGRNKLISRLFYLFCLNPLMAASSNNPFQRGFRGCGIFVHQNHAARWENAHHGGDVCVMCVSLAKSSRWKFFIPARMHLAVKLLNSCRVIADCADMVSNRTVLWSPSPSWEDNCNTLHYNLRN